MQSTMSKTVDDIMNDDIQSREKKVAALKELYEYARAEQRTASESMMVDDDGLNEGLRKVELALEELNADPNSPEDNKAATL